MNFGLSGNFWGSVESESCLQLRQLKQSLQYVSLNPLSFYACLCCVSWRDWIPTFSTDQYFRHVLSIRTPRLGLVSLQIGLQGGLLKSSLSHLRPKACSITIRNPVTQWIIRRIYHIESKRQQGPHCPCASPFIGSHRSLTRMFSKVKFIGFYKPCLALRTFNFYL